MCGAVDAAAAGSFSSLVNFRVTTEWTGSMLPIFSYLVEPLPGNIDENFRETEKVLRIMTLLMKIPGQR